ncbi:unnamed protein product [Diatraea saccharalis]|uniref:Uncharacterized protein n=1 Tax=Diatraea saccharalis TaxID=40085 RepID=A0A9N9RAJ9_9NEOP|nr:unnamed protein product [Diatraea saccharalis]
MYWGARAAGSYHSALVTRAYLPHASLLASNAPREHVYFCSFKFPAIYCVLKHGDINQSTKTTQGRMKTIKEWENLTNFLNSDATVETKTTEKWKKKAAKIPKAAYGTGGGPALQIRLTELEERVLNIIGPQSSTGLPVIEAGLPINIDSDKTATIPPSLNENEDSPSIIITVPQIDSENITIIIKP